jgi:hypothetical protein
MRTGVVRAALLTAGGVLLLLAWVVLGKNAGARLPRDDRGTFAFADIDCLAPGTLSRGDFLGEVQYLSNLPDRLPLSEAGMATRLALAFALHPSVKTVQSVEVLPAGVRVSLLFRAPVLAVPGPDALRAVDAKGVLLPKTMPVEGLPRLSGQPVAPPAAGEGGLWGDERVAASAAVAARLWPHRDRLRVEAIVVEGSEVTLLVGKSRVRWGRPPGQESHGEPDAAAKVLRLCNLAAEPGGLADRELDLARPSD